MVPNLPTNRKQMLTMIVEGEQVWIVTESGESLPLDASAVVRPSLSRTWIPSIGRSLWRRVRPAIPDNIPSSDQDGEEISEAEVVQNSVDPGSLGRESPSPSVQAVAKIGGRRRKAATKKR